MSQAPNRITIGILFGLISSVTDYQLYEYIRDDKPLFPETNHVDWGKWRNLAISLRLQNLTKEQLKEEFGKRRPDLLKVVIYHPKGDLWLESQISILRTKLGF
jgi:hypothetical protein